MHLIDYYYQTIVKYDLLNKFRYKNISQLPKLNKIVLYFKFNNLTFNSLMSTLLVLELITNQKGFIIRSKNFNTSLKVKKGEPIGCKVTLNKNNKTKFLFILINSILNNNKYYIQNKITSQKFFYNAISFKILNILNFKELEEYYQYFRNLKELNISIITNAKTTKEFLFLIKSLKIPFKN